MADTTKELIKKELYFLALYNTGIIEDVDTTKSGELYTYITREINNSDIRQKIKVFNKNIIIRFTHILLNELIEQLGENKEILEILETIKKNNIKNYYNNILNFFTALYYKDYIITTDDNKLIKQNIRILIELYKVLIKTEKNDDNYKDEINTLILNQQLYHSLFVVDNDKYNQKINNKYEILKQEMEDLTTINKINYLNQLCYL